MIKQTLAFLGLAAVLFQASCGKQNPIDRSPGASAIELMPITNMVFIKAGSFVRLNHPVTITRDYWLGRFEVTQAEFFELVGTNTSYFQGTNHPIEKVSHNLATTYCAALTQRERKAHRLPPHLEYRLPTEAEWEYACRAGSTNHFSFGDSEGDAEHYAWTAENAEGTTHPVGQKRPNAWGLHDMHGNVWEWCYDWFANYPAAGVQNPVGPPAGKFKVFRGGGWNQDAKFARSSNRFMMEPANGINFVGFRVALGPRLHTHEEPTVGR